jgi:hypothetical protein
MSGTTAHVGIGRGVIDQGIKSYSYRLQAFCGLKPAAGSDNVGIYAALSKRALE